MSSTQTSRVLNGLAAVSLAGGVLLATATPAYAQNGDTPEEMIVSNVETIPGLAIKGTTDGGEKWKATADVITLHPDFEDPDLSLIAYCVDLWTQLETTYPYVESEWEESGIENLEFVRWIMFNSYPNVDAQTLFTNAGFDDGADWDEATVELVAYAGTQAAVWHYTDGFQLDEDKPVYDVTAKESEAVSAIYNYLITNTGSSPDPDEYIIDLEGLEEAGYTDGKFGPYILRSNAGEVTLGAEGGSLVDAEGAAIESLNDGGEFYITLDEDSTTITINGTATYDLPVGRTFLATTPEAANYTTKKAQEPHSSQKLILAEPRVGEVPASWAFELEIPQNPDIPEAGDGGEETIDTEEVATPKLPTTGAGLTYLAAGAAALLVVGAIAVILMRRKNTDIQANAESTW